MEHHFKNSSSPTSTVFVRVNKPVVYTQKDEKNNNTEITHFMIALHTFHMTTVGSKETSEVATYICLIKIIKNNLCPNVYKYYT